MPTRKNSKVINSDETGEGFLTAPDVPPNLLRLKRGDVLSWTREPRKVARVGYRKRANDYLDEAKHLLASDAGRCATHALAKVGGVPRVDVEYQLARALAQKAGLGGPERGLHVSLRPWVSAAEPRTAVSTRCVVLGTYYPGSGGWSHGPDGSEYDYEEGGLSAPRTVVLVRLDDGTEAISGDLRRV